MQVSLTVTNLIDRDSSLEGARSRYDEHFTRHKNVNALVHAAAVERDYSLDVYGFGCAVMT